jgi:hypothetical protein
VRARGEVKAKRKKRKRGNALRLHSLDNNLINENRKRKKSIEDRRWW